MDGIIPTSRAPRGVMAVESRGEIYVFAQSTFVPTFQLARRRYRVNEASAFLQLARLSRETLHELLRLAGGFEAGPAVDGGFGGLERTLLPLLLAHRLKLFRLSLRERHHLSAPDSTLLINLREADYRDGWNSASTSPQQVRAAIAVELSRTLA